MATYLELARITEQNDWGDFFDKVVTATVIKATAIIDSSTPSAEAVQFAKDALGQPRVAADSLVYYVIGANDSATIAQIFAASDNSIQTNVDAAVDALYP